MDDLSGAHHPRAADASLGSLLVPERLSIWAWVLGYTAILTSLSVLRSQLWLSTGFDLGLYEQGLWQILHQGLRMATSYTGQPILAQGASWILIPIAPLYAIGGTGLLLAIQSFALGLGYLFLRRIGDAMGVPDRTSHLAGVIYLLYPSLIGANLFDFHPITLAVPLLFGVVWAALTRRAAAFTILVSLCFTIQSSVIIPLLAVGLVLLILRRPFWALAMCALATLSIWVDIHGLLPLLANAHISVWSAVVPTPVPLDATLRTLAGSIAHLRTWEYLAWIIGPVGLVVLTGRIQVNMSWSIPVIAVIVANLLSTSPAASSPFSDTTLLALPFLFTSVLSAHAGDAPLTGRRRAACLIVPVVALAVFLWHDWRVSWPVLPPNTDALLAATALIPSRAPVVAQNFASPALSNRPIIWLPKTAVARTLPDGTYILTDTRFSTRLSPSGVLDALSTRMASAAQAKLAYSHDGVQLYKLIAPLPKLTS